MASSGKLKYRIIHSTGEDSEYPVTELLTQSPQSRGWQSPRFCDYPQEITVQFMQPVVLQQIQFLSHQCKISSRIELYACLPTFSLGQGDPEIRYKKLGYLSLDSNERSNFQARELKSVYIEAPCLYVKLVFHKCHLNKYNLFNQVGLIALSFYGDQLQNKGGKLKAKKNTPQAFDRLEYATQFDKQTLNKLRTLEDEKKRAVSGEDYQRAKKLKEAIDRLKHIGVQLQNLEERKAIAVQNEDFDSAQIIHEEITRLRNMVAPDHLIQQRLPPQGGQHGFGRRPQLDQQENYPPQKAVQFQDQQPQEQAVVQRDRFTPGGPPDRPSPQKRKKKLAQRPTKQFDGANLDEDRPINPMTQSKLNTNFTGKSDDPFNQVRVGGTGRARIVDSQEPFDEQIIPAARSKRKGLGNFDEEEKRKQPDYLKDDQEGVLPDPEKLNAQSFKLAEPFFPVFGERFMQKVFSKTWGLREQALKEIIREYPRASGSNLFQTKDPGEVFTGCYGIVASLISDRISQVSLKALNLLTALMKKPAKRYSKHEFQSYTETIINGLVVMIGDSNIRLRVQSADAFKDLAKHNDIGVPTVTRSLLKNFNNRKTRSKRHMQARSMITYDLLIDHGTGRDGVPVDMTIAYAVAQLEHADSTMRDFSKKILIEMNNKVGQDKIRPFLINLRPKQADALQEAFDQAKGISRQSHQDYDEDPEPIITTNIGKGRGKGGKGGKNKKQRRNKAFGCDFCGRKDKDFENKDFLDIHLWRECPMLTNCDLCSQVVPIEQLNQHKLEICEKKNEVRVGPRCGQAVHMSVYKDHVEEMSCLPKQDPRVASRCPLCNEDVPPGKIGWKQHLLTDGCPNNERFYK